MPLSTPPCPICSSCMCLTGQFFPLWPSLPSLINLHAAGTQLCKQGWCLLGEEYTGDLGEKLCEIRVGYLVRKMPVELCRSLETCPKKDDSLT